MAEDASNKLRGYKATLSNPNVSDEAKRNAQEVIDTELNGGNVGVGSMDQDVGKNPGNVVGGLKAAINNPNVTEDGKQAAQDKLDSLNK